MSKSFISTAMIDVLARQIKEAKTSDERKEIIRRAMLSGHEYGRKQAMEEVENALRVLGFGDLAFKHEV